MAEQKTKYLIIVSIAYFGGRFKKRIGQPAEMNGKTSAPVGCGGFGSQNMFDGQQGAFQLRAKGVATQRAVCRDNTVAGGEDGERIGLVGLSDGLKAAAVHGKGTCASSP